MLKMFGHRIGRGDLKRSSVTETVPLSGETDAIILLDKKGRAVANVDVRLGEVLIMPEVEFAVVKAKRASNGA